MSLKIKVVNNLQNVSSDKNYFWVIISHKKTVDDVLEYYKYKSNDQELNSNEFIINTNKNIDYLCYVKVYLVSKKTSYLYKFLFYNVTDDKMIITFDTGKEDPIVRVNNVQASRRDEMATYGYYRFLCCCGSIENGLDDFEQAEDDAASCVIM